MSPPPVEASAELARRRASPGAKVADLFEQHARMVLGICRVLLRDPEEAEDAAQQTFLAAHRALLNGTVPRDDAAWLATIARNECRGRVRKRMATPLVVELGDAREPAAPESDAAEVAARNAELQALRAAIADLPERQREAIVLRELYGLSYEDVAAALNVSPPAVDSLLSRARRGLEERVRPRPSLAHGVLLVPASLREQLARLIPGFESAEVGTGVGLAGILGKLAALPAAAKVSAATATVVVGVGVSGDVHRGVPSSSASSAEAPAVVTKRAGHFRAESDRSGPSSGGDAGWSDSSGPSRSSGSDQSREESTDSDRSGSSEHDYGPESGSSGEGEGHDYGPKSGSSGEGEGEDHDYGRNDDDSSGPGSGPEPPPEGDNSGSGSDGSGSGSDDSGSGSDDSGSGSDNSGSGSDNSGSGSDNSGSGSDDSGSDSSGSGSGGSGGGGGNEEEDQS